MEAYPVFVKFKYFFKVLKHQENYKQGLDKALNKYSELSYSGILNCGLIPGIKDVLEALSNNKVDCFVVSVGGKWKLGNSLYFGDAWADFDAVSTHNMDFVYISGASEWKEGVEFCEKK